MAEETTLWISGNLAEKIRAHGAETYPHECCGALMGRDRDAAHPEAAREVLALFPLVNRRDDSPRNRFSVTAEDVLAADKAAQAQGLEVIDQDHAWPWYSYIIVSVHQGSPQDMTSWRLNDDREAFSPEGIEIRHGAAV